MQGFYGLQCSDGNAVRDSTGIERKDKVKAEVVKLRFFGGLTIPETAAAIGISTSSVDNYWAYAQAWLRVQLTADDRSASG